MTVVVKQIDGSHRLEGTWAGAGSANAFLSHLEARRFSPATVRAYAFDVMCLARFLEECGIDLSDLVPTDVFDWVDWQSSPRRRGGTVVSISAGRGAAPASVNRRVAAARAFFEYLVMIGARADNRLLPGPQAAEGGAHARCDYSPQPRTTAQPTRIPPRRSRQSGVSPSWRGNARSTRPVGWWAPETSTCRLTRSPPTPPWCSRRSAPGR